MSKLAGETAIAPPKEVGVVNIANALTVLRLVLVPVFLAFLFASTDYGAAWRAAAFATFVIAAVTDKIDGEVARRRGIVTNFGKIADPIADKALIGGALLSLSFLGELFWWFTGVILFRELTITVLRLLVLRHVVIPASRGGKAKTVLQVVAVGVYVLPLTEPFTLIRLPLMAAAVVVTLLTGVDYCVQAWRARRQPSRGER